MTRLGAILLEHENIFGSPSAGVFFYYWLLTFQNNDDDRTVYIMRILNSKIKIYNCFSWNYFPT